MIQFSLKCENDHAFDSWFQSGEAYEKLQKTKMIACPDCGSTQVTKALMAPRVRTDQTDARPMALTEPASEAEKALRALRKKVEDTSDYVGSSFAKEARAMHTGDAPNRSIYGEARMDEARSLLEDGIPVAPLPFTPKSKAN
jgi:hypothetical protein